MERSDRLWAGRLLDPVTAADIRALRDLRRRDVDLPSRFSEADVPPLPPDEAYFEPAHFAALELFADGGEVSARDLGRTLGDKGSYWALRAALTDLGYGVDWPDHPDPGRPMRIAGRIRDGIPRLVWDLVSDRSGGIRGPALNVAATVIEVIPPDADPAYVPLMVEFVGLPLREYPAHDGPLTGAWAAWVEVNRPLCAVAFAPDC